jgi:hypothetical protein
MSAPAATTRPWFEPLLLAALLLLPACGIVHRFAGIPGVVAYTLGTAAACIVVCRYIPELSRFERLLPRLMLAIALFAVVAFIILYPIAQSGLIGAGSDRDEALNQALDFLAEGRYPYHQVTYRSWTDGGERIPTGDPITPFPGAFLLAAPAWFLGNAAWQNVFWLIVLFVFFWRNFAPATALLLAAGAVAFYPGAMQDVVTGGDYYINAVYILIASACVLTTVRGSPVLHLAALVFLGIAVCSRPIYGVAPVALAAFCWRHYGFGAAFRILLVSGAVTLALALPFYLYDPPGFSPLHVTSMANLPIPHAPIVLGVLSLAVATLAARLPRDPFALYGWIAVSLCAAFGPLMAYWISKGELLEYASSLTTPVTLFGAVWIAKRLERKYGLTRNTI